MNKKFTYIIGAFLIQGITFLSTLILARLITPADYALVSSYSFIITIAAVFVGFNMESTITNAFFDFDEKEFNVYCNRLIIFSFIITLGILIIVSICKSVLCTLFNLPFSIIIIGIIQAFFNFLFIIYSTTLIVLNQSFKYIVYGSLNSILNMIVMFMLINIFSGEKYLGKVYSSLICAIIFGFSSVLILRRKVKNKAKKRLLKNDFKYAISLSGPLIFHSIGAIVMGRSDQLMIMNMISKTDAGIYGFANNFGNITSVFVTAFNKPYVPWYFDCMKKNKLKEIKDGVLHHTKSFTLLFFCILLVLPEIIALMADKNYSGSIYIAPLNCLAFYINFLYTIIVNHEFYAKKTKYISLGTIICCIINVITNFFAISLIGVIGASLTTILSNFILLCIHYYIVSKKIGDFAIKFNFFLFFTTLGTLLMVLTMFLRYLPYIRLILLIFTFIYLIKEMRYKL